MTGFSVPFDNGGPWSRTSTAFLEALKARDEGAWARVLGRACWHVYAVAQKKGLRQEEADDIVQDVLLSASQYVGDFEHNGRLGAFRAWLNAIVRSKLAEKGRERGLRLDLPVGGTDFLGLLADLSARQGSAEADSQRRFVAEQVLATAQAMCKPVVWEAFCRVVFENQAAEHVAQDLGISVNQVYIAKSRTIRTLKDMFTEQAESK